MGPGEGVLARLAVPMMRESTPDYAQLAALPAMLTASVSGEHVDVNGHMGVVHHLGFGTQALSELIDSVGLDAQYRATRGLSVFTAEHHLRYLSELRRGDSVAAHVQVIDRTARAVHALVYLVAPEHLRIASTIEAILVHVDLTSRSSVTFEPAIAAGLDAVRDRSAVPWRVPLSGAMGLRRSAYTAATVSSTEESQE